MAADFSDDDELALNIGRGFSSAFAIVGATRVEAVDFPFAVLDCDEVGLGTPVALAGLGGGAARLLEVSGLKPPPVEATAGFVLFVFEGPATSVR